MGLSAVCGILLLKVPTPPHPVLSPGLFLDLGTGALGYSNVLPPLSVCQLRFLLPPSASGGQRPVYRVNSQSSHLS